MAVRIHPSADVQSTEIGDGTFIWQNSVVLKGAVIGKNCNVNFNCFIENDVRIGDNVTVKSGVYLWDGIDIEDNVFIGPAVAFTNDLLPRSKQYPQKFDRIQIRQGASIGANATIIAPVEIGAFSMIGAGSVVTRSIPPYTLWYGNPARQKGYVTQEGLVLNMDLVAEDGTRYKYENSTLVKL